MSNLHWPTGPVTLGELLSIASDRFSRAGLFFGHGTDNAWDEAVVLALHGLQLPVMVAADESQGQALLERRLTADEYRTLLALFDRRIEERIPAAYITGSALFAGLEFRVTPDVLVPRSPIAELILNRFSPWLVKEPDAVLDLCTGSGCIGIATVLQFARATVDLSDISPAALQVAEHNVQAHKLADRVRLRQGDLFDAVAGCQYDLIVCNPPYVDAAGFTAMPDEYRAEPEIGLASGADGLDFCRRLLAQAGGHLSPQGVLVVEVGNSWEALEQQFPRMPFTWVDFEHGGHGVFVIAAEALRQ